VFCETYYRVNSLRSAALSLPVSTNTIESSETAPEGTPVDTLRITAELVQTDVVVTDKNDRIVRDLELRFRAVRERQETRSPVSWGL